MRDERLRRIPALAPNAATRTIEGEAVVVTPHDSTLHTLNPVGSRILALADGTRTVGSIAEAIAGEYDVDPARAEADVLAFVSELEAKGVLVVRDTPAR